MGIPQYLKKVTCQCSQYNESSSLFPIGQGIRPVGSQIPEEILKNEALADGTDALYSLSAGLQ